MRKQLGRLIASLLGPLILLTSGGLAGHSAIAAPSAKLMEVVVEAPESAADKRGLFSGMVLRAVLDRTVASHGPYRLRVASSYMERERLRLELVRGEVVNVSAQATQPNWEDSLLTIRIPVDLGVSSWRVSLILADRQPLFDRIETLDALRELPMGIGSAWSTRPLYQAAGFKLVVGANYENLFAMLMAGRFEHFPRGVNEAWLEYDDRKARAPELAVERHIALCIPLPKYFFVSPAHPRLAQRIEDGLKAMVADGSLRRLVMEHHGRMIARTDFCARRAFRLANPTLHPATPLNRREFWFDPYDPVSGLCKTRNAPSRPD